jgi:pimeloyl-ACP methyl ester carboxylesterase
MVCAARSPPATSSYAAEKSLYERVEAIAAPTTIVFGELDQRIDRASLTRNACTKADVVTIADAGHTPVWETPDPVADVLMSTTM